MDSSTSFVADYYRISHIAAATIPGSRLSNILAQLQQGRPLTKLALDFLWEQKLPGLYQLARGEITHAAYIAGLDAEQLLRSQAAMAAHQAKESERQALKARHIARETRRRPPNAAQPKDEEAERNLRRKQEREASEAVLKAQRARNAEWEAQRKRNCELAALAYEARAIGSNYTAPTAYDIARYFHLNQIGSAVCPPTSDILEALYRGRPLTADELNHLKHNVPDDLYQLAFGKLSFGAYIEAAKAVEAEAIARRARLAAAEATRIARENDPEYIAMMQTQALYSKYGVTLNDQAQTPRMTNLLRQIDTGNRLSEEELAWLSTEAKRHFTQEVRHAFHRLEADFFADQYRSTQSPWNVINASGHYRKCDRSQIALELLDSLAPDRLKLPKIRSAVFTTRGGVMRDLGRLPEAIQMGMKAHALVANDYRPCTLLGAVHMELREFENGREWYEKARARGAPEQDIDSELRAIFRRMDSSGREAMKRFLLAEDPSRHGWLNEKRQQETSRSRKR